MFNSVLSLYVEIDRKETRNLSAFGYYDGILTAGYPVNVAKESELYMAIAFMNRTVCSYILLDKQLDVSAGVPIGKVADVNFKLKEGKKNIVFSVEINENLQCSFEKFLVQE